MKKLSNWKSFIYVVLKFPVTPSYKLSYPYDIFINILWYQKIYVWF